MKVLTTFLIGVSFCCWFTKPLIAQDFLLEKLNTNVNTTTNNEIAPCISSDGNMLYFTRVAYDVFDKTLIEAGQDIHKMLNDEAYYKRMTEIYSMIAGIAVNDPIQSAFNQDIWLAKTTKNLFDRVHHPEYPLNNALPNSMSSFGVDNHELIVINEFPLFGGMRKGFSKVRREEDGSWSFPEPIRISNYHNSGSDVNITMSKDGNVMIMSMEREDAMGNSDLYITFRNDYGDWSAPENMGPGVNSLWRETTPHLSEDGKTLFFSSNREKRGATGSDIYIQHRLGAGWKEWTAPERFHEPVNSNAHDSHPYFNAATGYLYFNSTRDGTSDIFRIQIKVPASKDLNLYGIIQDETSGQVMDGRISIIPDDPRLKKEVYYSEDGHFRFPVPANKGYTLLVEKEDYYGKPLAVKFGQPRVAGSTLQHDLYINPDAPMMVEGESSEELIVASDEKTVTVSYNDIQASGEMETIVRKTKLDIKKEESPIGQLIELEPILFAQSKPLVLHKSYKALDQLAKYLKKNPEISILIAGHTDNRGNMNALVKLSKQRANAIKDYLTEKKYIDPNRIRTIGYGGTVPLNDNSTERLRRKNRRVEVNIINIASPPLGLRSEK